MIRQTLLASRLVEGLAPYAEANELKVLHTRVVESEATVPAIAEAVHSYYGELLTKRDLSPESIEAVEKPKIADDVAYWVEELENAVFPELRRYLEG